MIGSDGEEGVNDMFHENQMLNKETTNLRTRVKAMQETIDVLTAKNAQLLAEKEVGAWIGGRVVIRIFGIKIFIANQTKCNGDPELVSTL